MMAKYLCKENCFHSTEIKRYDQGDVYELSKKTVENYKKIGFMDYFEALPEEKAQAQPPKAQEKEVIPEKKEE
jgi:hypothetical protein